MNPEDDPEARIRQLEQHSANYGAVELGANQDSRGATPTAPLPPPVYGAPPPVPPYGSPYTGDPFAPPPYGTQYTPVRRKGAPIGLIFGLLAVLVVVVFGAIGVFVYSMGSGSDAVQSRPGGNTSIPGGGGTFGKPGGVPTDSAPTMEPPILPSAPGDGSVTIATPGGQLSVAGIDGNKSIACNDSNINVSGVNNKVTITGHCLSVTVSGVDNQVTVESADTIGASGFDNQVIYHSGDPEINNSGSNTVQQG